MEKHNINDCIKGWFIGNFPKAILKREDFEVSVKHYNAGESDDAHYHKVATEYTVIASGTCTINGKSYFKDDIIVINPGDIAQFTAISDVITVVVKTPSCNYNDKFMVDSA